MSNDEKMSRITEILHDPNLHNAAKFDLMEELVLGDISKKSVTGRYQNVDIVEYKGERYSVIAQTDTEYIATEPYFEMDGDTTTINKSDAIVIK
ncbi:hypothetical protein ACRTEV_21510 [Rossellomorea arthrocnemi]